MSPDWPPDSSPGPPSTMRTVPRARERGTRRAGGVRFAAGAVRFAAPARGFARPVALRFAAGAVRFAAPARGFARPVALRFAGLVRFAAFLGAVRFAALFGALRFVARARFAAGRRFDFDFDLAFFVAMSRLYIRAGGPAPDVLSSDARRGRDVGRHAFVGARENG